MKFILIKRFYVYGKNLGERVYVFNIEELISLIFDIEPKTNEVRLKIGENFFDGISFDCTKKGFINFLKDEEKKIYEITIYDDYESFEFHLEQIKKEEIIEKDFNHF